MSSLAYQGIVSHVTNCTLLILCTFSILAMEFCAFYSSLLIVKSKLVKFMIIKIFFSLGTLADSSMSSDTRIALIQQNIKNLKKAYTSIKSKLASTERQIKKIRRKEREKSEDNKSATAIEASAQPLSHDHILKKMPIYPSNAILKNPNPKALGIGRKAED